VVAELARVACERTAERRSTFTRANVLAKIHRQLRGRHFASYQDRLRVAEQAAKLALDGALLVSAPELHHVPERYRRTDGSSRMRPADQLLYTTEALLDAEQRLLDAGRRTDAPTVPVPTVARVMAESLPGREHGLSVDQALAVQKIATSGRTLDVLVGPAGTGKSTTMADDRTGGPPETRSRRRAPGTQALPPGSRPAADPDPSREPRRHPAAGSTSRAVALRPPRFTSGR